MNNLKGFLNQIQKKKRADENKGVSSTLLDDRKNLLDLNIFVMVDMSGSISNAQFNQFMSQLREIKGISRIMVAEYDDDVRALYNFSSLETYKPIYRENGSGGNYELNVFKYAEALKPDAILHMTDGGVMGPTPKTPDCPIGYILTKNGSKPYQFGEVVAILPSPKNTNNISYRR